MKNKKEKEDGGRRKGAGKKGGDGEEKHFLKHRPNPRTNISLLKTFK